MTAALEQDSLHSDEYMDSDLSETPHILVTVSQEEDRSICHAHFLIISQGKPVMIRASPYRMTISGASRFRCTYRIRICVVMDSLYAMRLIQCDICSITIQAITHPPICTSRTRFSYLFIHVSLGPTWAAGRGWSLP